MENMISNQHPSAMAKAGRQRAHQHQQKFLSALLEPAQAAPENLRHPNPKQSVGERFDIYRNNVIYSLRNALADKFPKLQKLVGAEAFDALADSYVRENLPHSPLLFTYGDDFPAYLADFAPLNDVPYAADVARLEVLWLACYHAANHTPLSQEDLLAKPIEACTMRLAPSLQHLSSDWPIYDIWQFLCDAGDAPDAMMPQSLLIFRDAHFAPQVKLLPAGGADFIMALQAGQSLTQAATQERVDALSQEGLQSVINLLVHEQQICDLFDRGEEHDKNT